MKKSNRFASTFNVAISLSILHMCFDFGFKTFYLNKLEANDLSYNIGSVSAFICIIILMIYFAHLVNKSELKENLEDISEIGKP
ncbi:hypothetical protein [Kaistella sp.]|uniref:hypothetical protein n=1 Tax=Kaistella sp. TaxID=2782235 RepID=UPI003C49A4C0